MNPFEGGRTPWELFSEMHANETLLMAEEAYALAKEDYPACFSINGALASLSLRFPVLLEQRCQRVYGCAGSPREPRR